MEEKLGHPYLTGNFAPVNQAVPLTRCSFEGDIPRELAGGQYVRNGGNPLTNDDLGRDAHWFDGDGMLSGVLFRRDREKGEKIQPEFVNRYLLTDVYCYAKHNSFLRKPVLPSIATLVSPINGLVAVFLAIFRSSFLVFLSRFRGRPTIRKISVANTNVVYHDGRALATCESGPPLRFLLPSLETIGWFNGRRAENEGGTDGRSGFGGEGPLSFMREWTTAHPRVDPVTRELITFHATFARPFIRCSVVKPSNQTEPGSSMFDEPVPGIDSAKMMHDFGVSRRHTVIMDLPLSLDPLNGVRGIPSLCYDATAKSRFGVLPRHAPWAVQWFETNPCLIFHTANCWDVDEYLAGERIPQTTINLLACRLTSATMMFTAGNLPAPVARPVPPEYVEEERCTLYYYSFPLATKANQPTHIEYEWSLSAIPFEFPSMSPDLAMRESQYIYGCSTSDGFNAALGKTAKIDYLCKFDVRELIRRGKETSPQPIKGCVDTRNVRQIAASEDPNDPIKIFPMPRGWFAQEPRFVPRSHAEDEDDGWLLTYVFDEAQLNDTGLCSVDSKSELWIIDAKSMKTVIAKIHLPQRVPYGLHGCWFSEEDIQSQRPYNGTRTWQPSEPGSGLSSRVVGMLERWAG